MYCMFCLGLRVGMGIDYKWAKGCDGMMERFFKKKEWIVMTAAQLKVTKNH